MKKIFFLFFLVFIFLSRFTFAQNYENTYSVELRNEFRIGDPDLTPEQTRELSGIKNLKNLIFIVGYADSRKFRFDSDKKNSILALSRAENTGYFLRNHKNLSLDKIKFYGKRGGRRTVALFFRKKPIKKIINNNEYITKNYKSGISRYEVIRIADSLDNLRKINFGLYFGGGYHLSKFNFRGLPIIFLGAKYKNLFLELEVGISPWQDIAVLPEGEMKIYNQRKSFLLAYANRFSRRSSFGFILGGGYYRDEKLISLFDEYLEKKEGLQFVVGLNYKSLFLEGIIRSGKDLFIRERFNSIELGLNLKLRVLN